MQTKCVIIKTRLRRNITARVYGLVKGHDDLGYVGNNEEKVIDQRHQTDNDGNDGVCCCCWKHALNQGICVHAVNAPNGNDRVC